MVGMEGGQENGGRNLAYVFWNSFREVKVDLLMVQRPACSNAREAMSLFHRGSLRFFFSFPPPQSESRLTQER